MLGSPFYASISGDNIYMPYYRLEVCQSVAFWFRAFKSSERPVSLGW